MNNSLYPSVGKSQPHESASAHVTGTAEYVDDIAIPSQTLHVAFALSSVAHATINQINVELALAISGVEQVLLAKDITHLYIGAVRHDEPLLADKEILFFGQAIAVVLADSFTTAHQAAQLITADVTELDAIITVADALAQNSFLDKPITMQTGDALLAINNAQHKLSNQFYIGGQEHFYLESQVSLAIPKENNEIVIYCSTQNPSEVQHLVAQVLDTPQHSVEVVTRRMGGAFGGKESDSSQLACICALLATMTHTPVTARLPRHQDMLMTGKRHDFQVNYQVGFASDGKITGLIIDFAAKCGYSLDLSHAIVSRALFHADNCYYVPNVKFTGLLCKTNTVSNTAFRGFGGPQGMLAIENIVEEIANFLKVDALTVRQTNFYQPDGHNITHYGQKITDNIINELVAELAHDANYQQQREQVNKFNQKHKYFKKGLALSPVKFGISFTTQFLNQAGALIHIYQDGSIYLNHGGTEMGQGLFIKIAQVVADEFAVPLTQIKVSATNTSKVPNTSPTAASSGSDLNGMAAKNACEQIKNNLIQFASQHFNVTSSEIKFDQGQVGVGEKKLPFNEFIKLAFLNRVELFSNGYYKTPKIHYDVATAQGRPFYYFSYGAAISEVIIDCLTGEYKLLAVDILHDVGASINPSIDQGQIVGGFIQGMGWLTSEELKWNEAGALLTTGASTYKIPAIGDTPEHFKVTIKPNISNHENTIHKSKAVGEPPLMLANSVWLAIKNAIFNVDENLNCNLDIPASFEAVFFKLNNLQ